MALAEKIRLDWMAKLGLGGGAEPSQEFPRDGTRETIASSSIGGEGVSLGLPTGLPALIVVGSPAAE